MNETSCALHGSATVGHGTFLATLNKSSTAPAHVDVGISEEDQNVERWLSNFDGTSARYLHIFCVTLIESSIALANVHTRISGEDKGVEGCRKVSMVRPASRSVRYYYWLTGYLLCCSIKWEAATPRYPMPQLSIPHEW